MTTPAGLAVHMTDPAPITERDMLGAMEVLASVAPDPKTSLILTDEELSGIGGRAALELLGGPYLEQEGVDEQSSAAAAVRSLAARGALVPLGDAEDPEGDVVVGEGEPRPFQLERGLAGVVALRSIPEAMMISQRQLAGGTTVLAHYFYPADGVLEEYVTIDGFHHFSVPPIDEVADRITRFADPFDDATADGEVETVTVPSPELEERFEGARALTVLSSMADDESARVTMCAVPGHMHMLVNGPMDDLGEDGEAVEREMSEVSRETLIEAITALVPRVGDKDGATAAESDDPA